MLTRCKSGSAREFLSGHAQVEKWRRLAASRSKSRHGRHFPATGTNWRRASICFCRRPMVVFQIIVNDALNGAFEQWRRLLAQSISLTGFLARKDKLKLVDSFRGSSVKLGTIQRRLAWPPRRDDMTNREWRRFFYGSQNQCGVGLLLLAARLGRVDGVSLHVARADYDTAAGVCASSLSTHCNSSP